MAATTRSRAFALHLLGAVLANYTPAALADIYRCIKPDGAQHYMTEPCATAGYKHDDTFWKEKKSAPPKKKTPPAAPVSKEQQFGMVVAFMHTIKSNLRDPDSLVWEYAGANDSATVLCAAYRARNGFGGYNREVAVATAAGFFSSPAAWNKHCTRGDITDLTHAKHAM